jgi:hypothetical protein
MLDGAAKSCDLTIEGVPCHKAVLAGFSEALRGELASLSMLSPKQKKAGSNRAECKLASDHGKSVLKSVEAVNCFLRFVYFGNVDIPANHAVELIEALADYQLSSLEAACEISITNGINVDTAFPILGVTFHPNWVGRASMSSLRNTVTNFIVQNFRNLDLNCWSGLPPVLFHALQALQRSTVPLTASEAPVNTVKTPDVKTPPPKEEEEEEDLDRGSWKPPPNDMPPPPPQLPAKPTLFVEDEDLESGESESD